MYTFLIAANIRDTSPDTLLSSARITKRLMPAQGIELAESYTLYNYHYIAGCWAIMHITWDWMPKEIRGVRLAVI